MKLARAIGAASALAAVSPEVKRLGLHGLALTGAAGGGAAIGYLAAGTKVGALTGALVNVALFGMTGAIFGGAGRLTIEERAFYALVGLGAGGGAGYLYWARRRR